MGQVQRTIQLLFSIINKLFVQFCLFCINIEELSFPLVFHQKAKTTIWFSPLFDYSVTSQMSTVKTTQQSKNSFLWSYTWEKSVLHQKSMTFCESFSSRGFKLNFAHCEAETATFYDYDDGGFTMRSVEIRYRVD